MATRTSRSDRYKLKTTFDGDHITIHTDTAAGQGAAEVQTRWRRKKDIGTGGSGIVWLEEEEGEGKRLRAVKRLHQVAKNVDWSRELDILSQLRNHQDLFVEFLGWYEDKYFVYFAMEFIEHGDLSQYLRKFGSKVMSQAKDIVTQLLKGLVILHKERICHRDIKPNNILIASISPIWVKIADFGVSKNQENTSLYTRCGTSGYLAPELQGFRFKGGDSKGSGNPKKGRNRGNGNSKKKGPSYTDTVDIWSLGTLTHKILTLEIPFLATDLESESESGQGQVPEQEQGIDVPLLFEYCGGQRAFPTESLRKSKVSSEGMEFVMALLVADPRFRMPAAQALKSPWLLNKRPEPYGPWEAQEREKEETRLARQKQDEEEQMQALEREESMINHRRLVKAIVRLLRDERAKAHRIIAEKKEEEKSARRRASMAEPVEKEREARRSREWLKVRENEAKKARREEIEYIRKNAGLDQVAKEKEQRKKRYSTFDPLPTGDIFGFTERSWSVPNGVPRLVETPPSPPPGMPRFSQHIHCEGSNFPCVPAEIDPSIPVKRIKVRSARAVIQATSDAPSNVTGKPFVSTLVAPVSTVPNIGAAIIGYHRKNDSQQQQQESQYYDPQLPSNFFFKGSVSQDPTMSESQSQSIYDYCHPQTTKPALASVKYGPAPKQTAYDQGTTISSDLRSEPSYQHSTSDYSRDQTSSQVVSTPVLPQVQAPNQSIYDGSTRSPRTPTSPPSREIGFDEKQTPCETRTPSVKMYRPTVESGETTPTGRRPSSIVRLRIGLMARLLESEEGAEYIRTRMEIFDKGFGGSNRGRREGSTEPRQSLQSRSTEKRSEGQPLDRRSLTRRSTEKWTAERQSQKEHQLPRRSTGSTLTSHEPQSTKRLRQPIESVRQLSVRSVRPLQENYVPARGTDINNVGEDKTEAESPNKTRPNM